MTKPGDKDWLSPEEYLRQIPKKRISGAAIFLDDQDRVLIVKPTYKDFWLIPGGAVNAFESPRQACIREVQEETGIVLREPPLVAVLHVARPSEKDDVVYFYYHGGQLSETQAKAIQLQTDELAEWKFVSAAEAETYTKISFAKKLPAMIAAVKNGQVLYFEETEETVD